MNKQVIGFGAMLVLGLASAVFAQTTITSGHWDIAAHEHAGELELELHNHDLALEEPLAGSTISYNFTNSQVNVTVGTNNLGLLWVSPASEVEADDLGLPFIGFSAEELVAPFTGQITFTITGFSYTGSGTGNFYMFEGTDLFFDSTAGPAYGSFSVDVGQHGHGEFGFSDVGLYEITMVASGNNGAPISSAPTSFTINVVPEPSTYALLGLGAGALALMRWRQRRRQA